MMVDDEADSSMSISYLVSNLLSKKFKSKVDNLLTLIVKLKLASGPSLVAANNNISNSHKEVSDYV